MSFTRTKNALATLLVSALLPLTAQAAIIDFTGGTVYQHGGATFTTNNNGVYSGVDYYEEDGFRLDFIGVGSNSDGFVGTYYGGHNNDVIHGHWATGLGQGLTEIRVSRVDGAEFDLNYFIMTSNTAVGGGSATGNEQAYINASADGSTISHSQLLPPDNWGFSGFNPQIFLGSQFDNIKYFSFTVANIVDCFGMDNFYIDEEFVEAPESAPLALLGLGLLGLVLRRRVARK
jgi:hypothetical protein